MEKYNEVMRVSWKNGEEKWGITPRQDEGEIEKLRHTELVEALIDIVRTFRMRQRQHSPKQQEVSDGCAS